MKHETRWPWWLVERWICWYCYGAERDVLHESRREALAVARLCVKGRAP